MKKSIVLIVFLAILFSACSQGNERAIDCGKILDLSFIKVISFAEVIKSGKPFDIHVINEMDIVVTENIVSLEKCNSSFPAVVKIKAWEYIFPRGLLGDVVGQYKYFHEYLDAFKDIANNPDDNAKNIIEKHMVEKFSAQYENFIYPIVEESIEKLSLIEK